MAVSLTSTVNLVFGSEVLDPVTGVILNDEVRRYYHLTMFCLLSAFRWMTSVFQGRPMGLDYGLHHVRMAPILLCPPDVWFHKDNYPEPGKRPLSSTTPTIIENADGSFYLSIGGSGGSRIFPAVFQVLLILTGA